MISMQYDATGRATPIVVCDNCGESIVCYGGVQDAEKVRFRGDWLKDNLTGHHYCPDCIKRLRRLFIVDVIQCGACGKTSELPLDELDKNGWRESHGSIICPDCIEHYVLLHTAQKETGNE